jgi:hypothetical protein
MYSIYFIQRVEPHAAQALALRERNHPSKFDWFSARWIDSRRRLGRQIVPPTRENHQYLTTCFLDNNFSVLFFHSMLDVRCSMFGVHLSTKQVA